MTGEELDARLDELDAKLEQVLATQDVILQRLSPAADQRHETLIRALVATMEGFDLPFTAREVVDRAAQDHELAAAVEACGLDVDDCAGLGALFRTLRDRDIGGYRIVRSGRAWRLARCT